MNLSTYDLGTRVTNTVFSLTKPKIFLMACGEIEFSLS